MKLNTPTTTFMKRKKRKKAFKSWKGKVLPEKGFPLDTNEDLCSIWIFVMQAFVQKKKFRSIFHEGERKRERKKTQNQEWFISCGTSKLLGFCITFGSDWHHCSTLPMINDQQTIKLPQLKQHQLYIQFKLWHHFQSFSRMHNMVALAPNP